jgi:hypothetical protein
VIYDIDSKSKVFDMFDNASRAKLSYFIVHTGYTQYRVYVIEPPFMDQ